MLVARWCSARRRSSCMILETLSEELVDLYIIFNSLRLQLLQPGLHAVEDIMMSVQ